MAEGIGPRLYSCCNCRNHVAIHDDGGSMNLIDEIPHCSSLRVPKIRTIFGVVGMLKLLAGKKKRGRPRKYGPDGANMSLALSTTTPSSRVITPGEKPRRGRPPGSGWKQQLAPLV